VTGEAREVAKVYAALVREIREHRAPFAPPVALISGGECTVTLPAGVQGRGGRCSEFLLSLAVELDEMSGVHALAADTDGIDGSEGNAGAVLAPDSIERAAARGIGARAALDSHDAYGFFEAAGGLVTTGATRTNVNDYRVILIR
jgi:hydroxypyruvate reductase